MFSFWIQGLVERARVVSTRLVTLPVTHAQCESAEQHSDDSSSSESEAEYCEVCSDDGNIPANSQRVHAYMHSECPVNRRELGRASWAYLHTLANYYPEKPNREMQEEMARLVYLFIKHYPCGYCADMSIQEMGTNPPRLKSRKEFAQWMCEMHNEVNSRMGKPLFDCSKVAQRWREGPSDGSCTTTPVRRS